ncbi:DUF2811 domain-containing protein [Aphanothece sacrum]|uniref:DUF2811 domain-containing protein n=1 Tax=Aphanothece sacrum FPU1 TaxID=1920663 RepID=A0A401IN98_APHSA|nr:DUF2811 domain-containing protein [Aphanothece sacrum]GBF82725.1 hypothetical protein AsFPU1_4159 [Aphanothece sacrum FPU1]GBF84484.1 hypothetical protein AsFPU3_1533 [Aphanothece sacrum FPU3]
MQTPIALEVEIPEDTYQSLTTFLESHSQWDFNEVVAVAVSHFLTQQKVKTNSLTSPGSHYPTINPF